MAASSLQLNVILVRPKYSRNIGSCARAAANMGVQNLYVVGSHLEHDNEARMAAAGAQGMLHSIQHFKNLDTLFQTEPAGLRIALTRREGKLRQADLLPSLLEKIKQEGNSTDLTRVYLIFGPEDHGLSNSDMDLCHCRCGLPIYGEFKSLNLSQAVLLACSLTQQGMVSNNTSPFPKEKEPIAARFPEEAIEEWLLALGFDLSARRNNAFIVLRRLLLSSIPTEKEISVLNSVVRQTIRILTSKK